MPLNRIIKKNTFIFLQWAMKLLVAVEYLPIRN